MKHSKYEQDSFFNKVYVEMYEEIYRFIRRITFDDNRILEDILQETFYEAYKKIDILIDHENYRGWVYKTAKFKALKLNNGIRITDAKQVDIINAEIQEVGNHDQYDIITYADYREYLTTNEFEFLIKHYIEGYTFEQLAKQENINLGACKMRLSRILKKLRNSIQNETN